MSRLLPLAVAVAGLLLGAAPGAAHDLLRDVTDGEAIVVRLYYADDTGFSFESYRVYREGETTPFQVGRTDELGRLVFIPDRAGEWQVRVVSEDGHGVNFTLKVDEAGKVAGAPRPFFDRYLKLAVGIAIILGLFGVLRLFVAGRGGHARP